MNAVSPFLLAALAAVLAGVLALEIAAPDEPPEIAARPRALALAAPATPSASGVDAAATERRVVTILARPLFEPDRRPPSGPRTASAAAAPSPPPRLAGTLVSPSGKRAIFVAAEGARPVTLGEGDKLDRWTVSEIGNGAVTLTSGQGALRLATAFGPRSPAGPPGVPPNPQPQVWRPQPDPAGVASSQPVTQ
jgi:hypothetical protein